MVGEERLGASNTPDEQDIVIERMNWKGRT
jgi:hypothetical protein